MIPSSFQLMGQTLLVWVIPEKKWTDDNAVGMYLPQRCEIVIRGNLPPQSMQQAFCHELTHAILGAMGKDELSRDEAFVDVFGSLLHQAWTTVEFGHKAQKKAK